MKQALYALVPFLVLLLAAAVASVISYILLMIFGDLFALDKGISKFAKLLLVLSIFPAMAVLRLGKGDLGLIEKSQIVKQFFQGLGLGIVTLLPVLIILFILGVNVVDMTRDWSTVLVLKKLLISFLLALLISLAEEPIFRGALLVGLKRKMSVVAAIIISSVYYALLHFLDSHTIFAYEDITFLSGFVLIGEALANIFNTEIGPAFLALFMVGSFLGIIRTRIPQSLVLCIGCHTAWVWQIKMSKTLFNVNPESDYLFLVSSYDGVIGPLVSMWMLLVISGYYGFLRIHNR